MTTLSGRRPLVDQACADAVDLARAALDDLAAPDTVGEHLGVEADDERVVTHSFDCLLPGYVGWRWAVTVMRASRGRTVTVAEAVLLPGGGAILAPEWLPWRERLRPGDLGPGDLLPAHADDARLEPGWNAREGDVVVGDDRPAEAEGDDDAAALVELVAAFDLGRDRVLSPIGLDDAVDRWLAGDAGPESVLAEAAPARCASCGFRVALRGRIGQAFGVCANSFSPSDGRVVALGHGCGAHSAAETQPLVPTLAPPMLDTVGYEVEPHPTAVDHEPGTVLDADPGEELGHG